MGKREVQRITKRALRVQRMSPERFAAEFKFNIWGASARTVRRWASGDSIPSDSVLQQLEALGEPAK